MGAARGDLARLAARRDGLARQVRAHPWVYGEIVRQLARVERVRILVQDEALEQKRGEC